MNTRSPLRAHGPAILVFGLLSLVWTFPLVLHLSTHVPGAGPGDNLTFVWNLWSMRTALDAHSDPFFTTYLFYPLGVDLAQHSHTAFSGLLAATVLRPFSLVTAQNVLLIAWVFLNGFVTYLLAHRLCGSRLAALGAGIVFGGAPAVLVRLAGHFNLVAAWVVPLAILLALRAIEKRTWRAHAAVGVAWAVAAYTDYYYLIYGLLCIGLIYLDRWISFAVHVSRRRVNRVTTLLAVLLAIDLLLILAVGVTGGFERHWGSIHLTMRTSFNLWTAFWLLAACWMLSRWRVSLAVALRQPKCFRSDVPGLTITFAVFIAAILPIVTHTISLVAAGDYASQRYYWRSAPAGVDIASVILGNPLHVLFGPLTQSAYRMLGLNLMEGVGWLGFVAPVVVFLGRRHLAQRIDARIWKAAAVVGGLWALGPFLTVFGTSTGMVLPATIIRFLPIVSNARIPGRAVVVVVLALAALLALVVARMSPTWSTARKIGLIGLLLLDCAAGPLALYRLDANAIYPILARQRQPGAVLELPIGIRDGFGEAGSLDHRTLYYQTMSERPMLGGFVARLPGRVKRWYLNEQIISTLLELSDPSCPPSWTPPQTSRAAAYQVLAALSIRYVVIDRPAARASLVRYIESTLPLRYVTEDAGRQLFEVIDPGGI